MHLPALFPSWFSAIPTDWIILFVFLLLVTFDAMRSGSGRASVLALTFPITALLLGLLPHTFLLGNMTASLTSAPLAAAVFFTVFAVTGILIYRFVYNFGGISGGLFLSFLAGLSATIVSAVIWLQVPALQTIWHFGPQAQAIFGTPYALLWLLVSYLILAFVRS